ncbi:MAG: hypothetical protein NXI31_12965 [bacterium]|nr:hypothetical protein [bacterium]
MAFHTTRWSLIARASGRDEPARRALDELCRIYWPAVYAMYRADGLPPDEAGDLTQGLFAHLLERGDFERAEASRGRFRGFLATCARNWRANERRAARAEKRGGDVAHLSLEFDLESEEARWSREPVDRLDAAALFDRRWAQAAIERALSELTAAEIEAGRGELLPHLRPTLEGQAPSWARLAAEIGTTEGALRVAAHRLRQRFRDRLEAVVRDTLADPTADGAELSALWEALDA